MNSKNRFTCPMPSVNFTGKDSMAKLYRIKKVWSENLLTDLRMRIIDPIRDKNDRTVQIF